MANDDKPAANAAPVVRTLEEWLAQKKPEPYLVAAAKVMNGWAVGQLLTEEQFDKGLSNQPMSR